MINREVTTDDQHFYILVISFFIILSTILIYYSIKRYGDMFIENERYKALEKINVIERDNYNNMVKSNEEIRSIKHDMNNMLISLGYFIKEGEYDKSISVINSQLNSINEKTFYTVNNSILQAFLNYYVNCNSDIKFNLNLNIQQELQVNDTDFISLLGNLFKNAVEAVNKLDSEDKMISIIFKTKNEKIFIQFQNIYSNLNMVDGKLYTTKSNTKDHGIGLSNIKNIVDKYNGFMNINTENKIFTIKLMLDNGKVKHNVK